MSRLKVRSFTSLTAQIPILKILCQKRQQESPSKQMPLTAFHWMQRLRKWQPKPTERSGGHIHWIHPSCRLPALLTCEQAAAERQLSCTSTYRSLFVGFRLQRNHKWCTIDSCHQQHSGSHGWQHHQALLQWRHLPDHHGGAGGHVQAHPYWNLTGDQQVTQTRGEEWRFTWRLWTPSEL